jgi:heme-degrading monooxygenase HmoA
MFCVVYEFKVKNGLNAQFEKSWAEFTEAIYRVRKTHGSRLHKTNDPSVYVAYAQWPSKESFDAIISGEVYTASEQKMRADLTESLESTKVVYKLDLLDDRFKSS